MAFLFIDNNAPLDRQSQRRVRNHAMKGKNLGKVIPARGHKRQQPQREDPDKSQLDHLISEPSYLKLNLPLQILNRIDY